MRYLKDNHRVYLLLLVVILVFDSLLMLCNIDISLIVYPNVIALFVLIVYAIYDYCKYKNKHELLIKGFYDDFDCYIDDNTLTVNINRLRKKCFELSNEDFIKTRVKQGYIVE